jgi:ribosomal protein S24E
MDWRGDLHREFEERVAAAASTIRRMRQVSKGPTEAEVTQFAENMQKAEEEARADKRKGKVWTKETMEQMKVRAATLVPGIREMLQAARGPSDADVRALVETSQWEGDEWKKSAGKGKGRAVEAEDDQMDVDDEADWYTEDLDARAEAMVPIIWERLQAKGRVSEAEVLELAEKMACEEDERRKLADRAEAMIPMVRGLFQGDEQISEQGVRELAARLASDEDEARKAKAGKGKGKGKGKAKVVEDEENISEQEAAFRKKFLEREAKALEEIRLEWAREPTDEELREMEREEAELDDDENDEEWDYEL